jgi:toxin secretion/phage lysis holin
MGCGMENDFMIFMSGLVKGIGKAPFILFGMMTTDFITGLMVAYRYKEFKSSIGRNGLINKMTIILLIGAMYMIDAVTFNSGYIGQAAAIGFIINEFISITENAGKLGIWMPKQVKDVIAVLKGEGK